MPSKIVSFYPVYNDLDGSPLANGSIYIGTAGKNPQVLANQINVYWDEDLTIPAAQPIRTINGYPSRSGSPAAAYTSAAEYSLTVLDKNGLLIYSELNAFDEGTRLRNDLASTATDDGTKGFHLVYYPPLSGETGVVNYEYPWWHSRRWGITGDETDETTKFSNAITSTAATGFVLKLVDCPTPKITGTGLTFPANHPGMVGDGIFNTKFYCDVDAGETAMTVNVSSARAFGGFQLIAGTSSDSLSAARATARNGIKFVGQGGQGNIGTIKSQRFNGCAYEIEDVFDLFFESIIVTDSGNSSTHAFIADANADTCNHITIGRLQVELSYGKAMYFDPKNINITVLDIHSERTEGPGGGAYTHELTSARSTFMNVRIEGTSDVLVKIGAGGSTYQDFHCPSIDVNVNTNDSLQHTIAGLRCNKLLVLNTNNSPCKMGRIYASEVQIEGGTQTVIDDRSIITTLDVQNTGTVVTVRDSDITNHTVNAVSNTLRAYNCNFDDHPPNIKLYMRDCVITNAYTSKADQEVHARGCEINGIITLNGNDSVYYLYDSDVNANLAYSSGAAHGVLDDRNRYAAGVTVATAWYDTPTTGTWEAGIRRYNPFPTAGGTEGEIVTTKGTFSSATDSTGDTDGSTAVISGMTDTSDFAVGEYVTVSAGFPSSSTPYRIESLTSSTMTLDTNSDSAQSNVTVATVAPVFKALGVVAA